MSNIGRSHLKILCKRVDSKNLAKFLKLVIGEFMFVKIALIKINSLTFSSSMIHWRLLTVIVKTSNAKKNGRRLVF